MLARIHVTLTASGLNKNKLDSSMEDDIIYMIPSFKSCKTDKKKTSIGKNGTRCKICDSPAILPCGNIHTDRQRLNFIVI